MTYIKIINNYIWDGLIRNLTRQLANRTKNDNLNHQTLAALTSFWEDVYDNELAKLKEALMISSANEEQIKVIMDRFNLTYQDNFHDAKTIWKRMNGQ